MGNDLRPAEQFRVALGYVLRDVRVQDPHKTALQAATEAAYNYVRVPSNQDEEQNVNGQKRKAIHELLNEESGHDSAVRGVAESVARGPISTL